MTKNGALIAVVMLLMAALLASSVLGVLAFSGQYSVSTQNCEEIETVKTAIRQVLTQSQRQFQTSKIRTPQEKAEVTAYYQRISALFVARHC